MAAVPKRIPHLDHSPSDMPDYQQDQTSSRSYSTPRGMSFSNYSQEAGNFEDPNTPSDQEYHGNTYVYTSSPYQNSNPVWGTLPARSYSSEMHIPPSAQYPYYGSPTTFVPQPTWASPSSEVHHSTHYLPQGYSPGGFQRGNYPMPYQQSDPFPHAQPFPVMPLMFTDRQQLSPRMNPLPPSPETPELSPSPGAELAPPTVQQGSEQVKDKPLYSHKEQLQFFRDALSLPFGPQAGPFIPQTMYKPHTNSDRRRYVEEVDLEAPIYFWVNDPHECGISLADALHSRVRRLLNRDETVFEGRGPSVSIRLEWPGYRQWSRQIPTKDFKSPPGPITRAKLAKNVAKCVQRFISERQNHSLEDDADARWRVGTSQNQIKLEDLILVSIHHVSMGSWQPQLRLRRHLNA